MQNKKEAPNLYHLYVTLGLSAPEIGKSLNVGESVVYKALKKQGISVRKYWSRIPKSWYQQLPQKIKVLRNRIRTLEGKLKEKKRKESYQERAPASNMSEVKGWKMGICAICLQELPTCQDHCHRRKRNRGRLCNRCNTGLGQFQDDIKRLQRASRYLSHWGKR